ncbi:SPASM domain-containing protein [Geoalkalibacter sp.]|uniref:SPASM domain-containing protein n=1 Tax=Geoalkalibacter sp. TaxID=3041440 RepID=UPI00272ED5E5|nr:SPASM domain-containing protein [Geoalkalibacter sp.]
MRAGLICTQPFDWCEVHGDGSVFLCCPAWLKAPAGNLLRQSLDEIWNGPLAREVRKGVLNGSFHRCGRRCPRLAAGRPPVMLLDRVEDSEIRAALGAGQSVLPYGPKTLNLCLDHRCNLACPSCRSEFLAPGASSTHVDHLIEKILADVAPHAQTLVIAGHGEPFASPAYGAILRGYSPAIWPRLGEIRLHTNGLLWDEAAWQSIAAAHSLIREAEISVDAACAATYALNRGGDWQRLLANLRFIATLPLHGKLSFVVQRNNFREMPAFVELARSLGFSAYFSQLVNWGTFSREEYRRRAVHIAEHSDHEEFLAILSQIAGRHQVDLGNLAPLLNADLP